MTSELGEPGRVVPIVSYKSGTPSESVIVPAEDVIAAQIEALPSQAELNLQISAVVAKAMREILTGKLQFKSASDAARVTKDLVTVAEKLNLLGTAAAMAKATTDEERMEAFKRLQAQAQQRILELPDR